MRGPARGGAGARTPLEGLGPAHHGSFSPLRTVPSVCALCDFGGEELAKTSERTELERADRAFVLAEDLRDLTARHVLDEAQNEHFLLLGREVLHRTA